MGAFRLDVQLVDALPCTKGAAHLVGVASQPLVAAAEGDAIRFNKLSLRQSPSPHPRVGVSRLTHRVLGAALGERADEALAQARTWVPINYWDGSQ